MTLRPVPRRAAGKTGRPPSKVWPLTFHALLADPRLRFHINGPGEIVATDNGDPTDMTSFASLERNAFNVLGLVVVRSLSGRTGTITVRAEADSLRSAGVSIKSDAEPTR